MCLYAAINLRVYTLKEETSKNIKFESGRLTTAQEIQEAMIKELGLPKDADKVFCIWLTSKHLREWVGRGRGWVGRGG